MDVFDVLVVGGGSGLTVAYYAERDGRSVALVENDPHALGGTCVNRGCLPTKDLIQSADVLKTIRDAEKFGIHVDQSAVAADFPAIMKRVREARSGRAGGVRSWVESSFTPFYGRARFVDEKTVEMEDGRRVKGERVFIATGARSAVPPTPGLEDVAYWTSENIFEMERQPERLIVIGGGYIGSELAHFFGTLGTEVTLIHRSERLLKEDEDIQDLFTEEMAKKANLALGADPTGVRADGDGIGVEYAAEGTTRTASGDALLVATGRRPNTDGLEAGNSGVELDERGWVRVNDRLQTSHPEVYAYGDVIGQAMFKHTSSYEGKLAYENAFGAGKRVDYRVNPHAVFSDPQVGSVGLTEEQCRERGLRYKSAKVDYHKFAKGEILGSPPGLAKVLVEEGTERILGFHMAGPGSPDLIQEVVVAMNAGAGTADLVRDSIHVHPAVPELIQKVFSNV